MEHGRSGYRQGCKCPVCRAGNTAMVQRTRASRLARLQASPVPESDPGHGTIGGYDAGCRCEACALTRRCRYWIEEGGPRRHVWRESVTEHYRVWRAAWEVAREEATIGYHLHRSRHARARSTHKHPRYADEYVDFLEDRPAPTFRAALVSLSEARV